MPARIAIRRLIATCIALCCFGATSSSLALEATPQERERARGLLDRGDQLTAAGDYRGALEAYTAADEIMGVPTTGIEVGRTQRSLGLLLEARDTWIQVTRYPVMPEEPPPFTKARQEAARLAAEIGKVIPTISIHVDGALEGAYSIYLDDAELSRASAGVPLRVNPGRHVVRLETEGHEPASTEITLKEGESPEITLRPGSPVSQQERKGADPISTSTRQGGSPLRRTAGFVGLGVGAVGISMGSIFGGISLAQASRAKDECEGEACPPSAADEIRTAKWTGTVSTVAFIIGGIGAAGGLYFLLTSKSEPRASGAKQRGLATHVQSLSLHPRQEGAQITVEGVF